MTPDQVLAQQTKRHLLNLLIQGAAINESAYAEPLSVLDPVEERLNSNGSQVGVGMVLSQFETSSYLLAGQAGRKAKRFWKSIHRESHPFHHSTLLREHGFDLAMATYERACAVAEQVGIPRSRGAAHNRRLLKKITALHKLEAPHRHLLEDLACSDVSTRWGVPRDRLTATLTQKARLGQSFPDHEVTDGLRETILSQCSAGWCRVSFNPAPARVEALAVVFPLLRHELVKGVCELSCSHGLAGLDNSTYKTVISVTDKIQYERSGMQVGPTLFDRWCESIPADLPIATALMHLSLSDPDVVESTLVASLEDPLAAQQIMRHLCRASINDLE